MRRSSPLAALAALAVLAGLGLAGCGGSSGASTSSGASSSSSSSSSSSASSTAAAPTSSSTTATTASSPGTGTTTSAPPASSTTQSSSRSAANGRNTNVRLAARFTIRPGGLLSPPLVAAPKHTEVVLTVAAGDGRHHTLVVQAPRRYAVSVGPGHAGRLILKGVPNGSYSVDVDGAKRGQLIIGAAPGP